MPRSTLPNHLHPDCRSRSCRRQRTGNWVAGTNLAIGLASGRYLSCLHQDDLWLPGRYQQLRAAVERLGEPDLIVHPAQFIGATGKVLGEWRCPLPTNGGLVAPEVMLSRLLVQNFLAMPAPMFRRAAIERVGGFDETLWYTADWDLWLKLATIGPTLYLPTPLACFRLHQESQTASRSADAAEFRRQLETVLARHLPPHSATANNAGRRLAGVAQFSIDVNTFLAALSHGQRQSLSRLAWRGFRLGPLGWLEYWRDSRIGERVASRLRLRRGPVA